VTHWDSDNLPDLVIGLADGRVILHLNIGTIPAPVFDEGQYLQVGPPGEQADLDVGYRATPSFVDWNDDDRRDLVVGAYGGRIHLFINEGTDTAPDFPSETFAQTTEGELTVPSNRSSPDLTDFNGDGLPDLISGNTNGELVAFTNVGTAAAPLFAYFALITSQDVVIDLDGSARSRPFSCDWNLDGHTDLLVGGADGKVRLYMGYEGNVVAVQGPTFAAARLLAPWPNPFNPTVNLACELDVPSTVTLAVYDVVGRELVRLIGGELTAGRHEFRWHGQDDTGRKLPTGLYFARLITPRRSETRKLTILR